MKIEDFLKLEDVQEAINKNDFKFVYDKAADLNIEINQLTYVLLSSDINPLEYMDEVPAFYFYAHFLTREIRETKEIKSIYIPDSIRRIREYAFASSGIEEIRMSPNITNIGTQSFFGCTKIKEIVLPEKLNYVRRGAFEKCTSLENIVFEGTKSQLYKIIIIGNIFEDCATSVIHCKDGIVEVKDLIKG